nr:TPA_asm: m41 uORF RNA *2 [Murid betaherpesvirus 1]DBA07972.1 TPA_asm: m41 uORF RNA *2 [Murid betaherpesvirus 1]
MTMCAD